MDLTILKRKIFIYSGVNVILRHLRKKPRILFWHGVGTSVDSVICPEIFDVDIFKQQIEYLNLHYEIISIQEFHKRLENNSFNGKEVLLTFDDGYANNLYVVEPILSKLKLPFTIFISTDNISTGDLYPTSVNRLVTIASSLDSLSIPTLNQDFALNTKANRISVAKHISREMKSRPVDEVKSIVNDLMDNLPIDEWLRLRERFKCLRPLNWNEVNQLAKNKQVTIGSHCKWHICCHENQNPDVIRDQIISSKQIIEDQLQINCDYFAYPNGSYTHYSVDCVNSTYKMGFSAETKTTVDHGNKSLLPRITGYISDMNLFKILVSL